MTFTFACQSCDDSFDIDYTLISEDPKSVKCPNCGKKLSASEAEDFIGAVDEVLNQVASLRKRFAIQFEVDAEDLPGAFESDAKRAARGRDEDEDEEETDDEDGGALEEELGEDEDDERF